MAAMDASVLQLLALFVCLLGGGGNDLLDYLPTESYWSAKQTSLTIDAMLAELAPPKEEDWSGVIAQLASPDAQARQEAEQKVRQAGPAARKQLADAAKSPDAELAGRAGNLLRRLADDAVAADVRRLMAIRTLGEFGDAKALPALRSEVDSKSLFVAEYAQAAIAKIEGKPFARFRPVEAIAADAWNLPESVRCVAQLAPRGGRPVGYAELLAALKSNDAATRDSQLKELTDSVVQLAELVGNVRIDAITLGVDEHLSAERGAVFVAVRGLYDRDRLTTLLKLSKTVRRMAGDVEIFEPTGEFSATLPSNNELLIAAASRPQDEPIARMLALRKANQGGLRAAEPMAALIRGLDTTQPLWLATKVSPSYRELPIPLEPFDTVTLVGTQEKSGLNLKLTAEGLPNADPAAVAAAAQRVNLEIAKSLGALRPIVQVEPILRTGVDFLETVHAAAAGRTATVTGVLAASPATVLSLTMAIEQAEEPTPAPAEAPKVR